MGVRIGKQAGKWIGLFVALMAAEEEMRGQTRASMVGTVRDASGAALPGATLTLASPDLAGGPRLVITSHDGTYRFVELSTGTYEIQASLTGFQPVARTGIRIPFGATVTEDFTLAVSGVSETVQVRAGGGMVDVKSAAAPARLGGELLSVLPTNRSTSTFLFNLTPGVVGDVAFGAAQGTTGFMLDGVPVTGSRFGNSAASRISVNWVDEIQVVSLGASAEHGGFTGGSANMVIRSGGNTMSGLVDAGTTRSGWLADNRGSLTPALQTRFQPIAIAALWDLSAQAGGPLRRDRLFYFAAVEYYKDEQRPAGALGDATSDTRHPKAIGKLTWAAAPSMKLEATTSYDNLKRLRSEAGPTRPLETLTERSAPNWRWNARFTWTVDPRTLIEVRNGGMWNDNPQDPIAPLSRSGPSPRRDLVSGLTSANVPTYSFENVQRNLTGATVTRYADGLLGHHDFKAGLEFELTKSLTESGFPGGRSYQDQNGVPYQAQLWDGSVLEGTGKRTTIFLQDQWRLTDRLTLQPGVRLSINRGSVPDKGTVFETNPFAARIGAAWDVTADHRTVVRAHYGRYDDPLLTGMFDFMDTTRQPPTITARVLADGTFQELSRVTPASNFGIDASLTHNSMDQFLVGMERELFADLSLQAQYIRRDFRNFMAFVDTGSIYAPVSRQDPGADNVLGTSDDGEFLTVYNLTNPGNAFLLLTNPDDAYRRYNGVQVVLRKRESHGWQMQASYTHSKTKGSVGNEQGTNVTTGTTDTSITGAFANPNRAINNTGLVAYDYPDQLRIDGSYRIPFLGGFVVSGVYNASSGQAWGRRATIRGLNQGTETVRIEPRGTRRNTGINQLDLRLAKLVRLGGSRTLQVYGDIFNTGNQGAAIRLFGTLGVVDTSGATFGTPTEWTPPRTLRLGARLTF
jgi:hypothetical protein